MSRPKLGIRWTIGDVRSRGFVALRLSVAGAYRLFGDEARYVVCVNSIGVERARALTGEVPAAVEWEPAATEAPPWLRASLGPTMADGVAWKLFPLRRFPELLELSLDNDVVFWSIPPAMRAWLDAGDRCLLAEDVHPAFGQFSAQCGEQALNTGIRGLPPGFDLEERLRRLLGERPLLLESELDEQGLQVAAIRPEEPLVVAASDVTICSPFPPHVRELGQHGAHFVGLNTQRLPFRSYAGRPSEEVRAEHFDGHLPELLAHLGAPS
jgi:hypothetical protein